MLPHLTVQFELHICLSIAYWRLKTRENFKFLFLQVGRGRLKD